MNFPTPGYCPAAALKGSYMFHILPPSSFLLHLPPLSRLWCIAALSGLLNGSPAALFSFLWTMLILSLRGGDRKQSVYYTAKQQGGDKHSHTKTIIASRYFIPVLKAFLIIRSPTLSNHAYSNFIKGFGFKPTTFFFFLNWLCVAHVLFLSAQI